VHRLVEVVPPRDDPQWMSVGHDVRVMVVDDQEIFLGVMRELVAAADGFELVGEATSGEEALTSVGEVLPEFVVVDGRLPGMGGLQTATVLRQRRPDLVVLLVSVNDESTPAAPGPSRAIPFVRKADLRPAILRQVWEEHRPRNGA
jgi:CheY-like chemotaxis protein